MVFPRPLQFGGPIWQGGGGSGGGDKAQAGCSKAIWESSTYGLLWLFGMKLTSLLNYLYVKSDEINWTLFDVMCGFLG